MTDGRHFEFSFGAISRRLGLCSIYPQQVWFPYRHYQQGALSDFKYQVPVKSKISPFYPFISGGFY